MQISRDNGTGRAEGLQAALGLQWVFAGLQWVFAGLLALSHRGCRVHGAPGAYSYHIPLHHRQTLHA